MEVFEFEDPKVLLGGGLGVGRGAFAPSDEGGPIEDSIRWKG